MKGRRHTPEQVVRKLHEADKLIGQGKDLAAVLKHLEVSEQTYYRWRKRFGELSPDDAKRLRELESENRRLKKGPAARSCPPACPTPARGSRYAGSPARGIARRSPRREARRRLLP
jgi:transposase-like protein